MTRFKQFKLKGASQSQEVPQPAMIFDLDGTLVDSACEHVWMDSHSFSPTLFVYLYV